MPNCITSSAPAFADLPIHVNKASFLRHCAHSSQSEENIAAGGKLMRSVRGRKFLIALQEQKQSDKRRVGVYLESKTSSFVGGSALAQRRIYINN
jgi:hypothetical protein